MTIGSCLGIALVIAACSDPEPTSVSQVVGPAGGTIEGPAGASLIVPGGAVDADTTISIKVAAPGSHPALDASFAVAGQVFAFEPHGLTFASPVTITLPVTGQTGDLVALRSEPAAPWEPVPANITGSTATITTTTFSWYCVASSSAPPPVDAGVDAPADASADAANPDAGTDELCAARTPGTASSGSVANMTGTAPSYTAGANVWPELALSTVVGGYATGGAGGARVHLTDFTGACGLYQQGLHELGGASLFLYLYSPIAVGAYTGGLYIGTQSEPTGSTAGACTYQDIDDGMPPMARTVTITAIDATHIAGSFTATYQGQAISGDFDVPFCTQAPNLDPPACCIP